MHTPLLLNKLVHVRLRVFSQKLARWADLSGDRVVSTDMGVVSADMGAGERGRRVVPRRTDMYVQVCLHTLCPCKHYSIWRLRVFFFWKYVEEK